MRHLSVSAIGASQSFRAVEDVIAASAIVAMTGMAGTDDSIKIAFYRLIVTKQAIYPISLNYILEPKVGLKKVLSFFNIYCLDKSFLSILSLFPTNS